MRELGKATLLELKLLARDPVTVVFTLALPLVVLYVLGAVFGNRPDPSVYRGVGPMNFYVPAYIGLVTASMGLIGLPVQLAGYRERGILKRFRASEVPVWSVLGGQVATTVVAGAVGSLVLWAAAMIAYGIEMPKQPGQVLLAFLLGALCFGSVGILLGAVLPTARAAQGAGIILWFLMMMLSGPGPPREVLNETLRAISDATPLRHVVVLIQDPWLGFGWNLGETLVVVGVMLAAATLAWFVVLHPVRLPIGRRRAA